MLALRNMVAPISALVLPAAASRATVSSCGRQAGPPAGRGAGRCARWPQLVPCALGERGRLAPLEEAQREAQLVAGVACGAGRGAATRRRPGGSGQLDSPLGPLQRVDARPR